MGQLTQNDRLHILNLAETFTIDALQNEPSNGMCFTIAYPLWLHFLNNNIACDIVRGDYRPKSVVHFWLRLKDDPTFIIDPTFKQFYPDMPLVFNGPKPEDYEESSDNLLNQYVNLWKDALLNGPLYDMLPPEVRRNSSYQNQFDFPRSLKISLTAAGILNDEMEQLGLNIFSNHSPACEHYFNHICEIVRRNFANGEIQKINLSPKVNSLVLKCKAKTN